ALTDQLESVIEWHSVEQKPSQPQVVSVTEQRGRQYAGGEGVEEVIVTKSYGRNDDRHAENSIRWISPVPGRLQLEKLRIAPSGSHQFFVGAEFGHVSAGDYGDPVGDAHRRKPVRDHDADPAFEILFKLGEDGRFGLRVERRGGFVQNPDIGIAVHDAG